MGRWRGVFRGHRHRTWSCRAADSAVQPEVARVLVRDAELRDVFRDVRGDVPGGHPRSRSGAHVACRSRRLRGHRRERRHQFPAGDTHETHDETHACSNVLRRHREHASHPRPLVEFDNSAQEITVAIAGNDGPCDDTRSPGDGLPREHCAAAARTGRWRAATQVVRADSVPAVDAPSAEQLIGRRGIEEAAGRGIAPCRRMSAHRRGCGDSSSVA